MFNQKTLLAALILGTSTVALANGGSFAPVPSHHVGYFYIGAGVSTDMGNFDTTYNTTSVDVFDQDAGVFRTQNFDWSGDGVDGDLYVGYQMVFKDHYTLGIELFGLVSSLKGDFNHHVIGADPDDPFTASFSDTDAGSIKMKDTLGIALLPGVKASESTTLYFRIGYVNSCFEFDSTHADSITRPLVATLAGVDESAFFPGVLTDVTTLGVSQHKSKAGIQLGVGAQVSVTNHVAIRVEGDWERYGTIDFNTSGFDTDGDSFGTLNGSVKPTILSAKLSAIYMFNAA